MITLNCNFDTSSTEFESFISYKNAKEGYLVLNTCTIKDEDSISGCTQEILEAFTKTVVYDMSLDDVKYIILSNPQFNLYFRTNTLKQISVKIYTRDLVTCKVLYDICIKFTDIIKDNKDVFIYEYHTLGNDISYRFNTYIDCDTKTYYYPYLNTENLIDSFLRAQETILVVTGEGGVGKSKFTTLVVKYIKDHYDECIKHNENIIKVGYVNTTECLLQDSFWMSIVDEEVGLVIIDDLEYLLSSRETGVETQNDAKRNQFLDKFLSFTDGIIDTNIKFIITTNQDYQQFDKSLMRKGRMFDILKFRALTKEEALSIWELEELDPKDFPFKEGKVFQCDLDSEMYLRKNNIHKDYLKEIALDYNSTRKLGL